MERNVIGFVVFVAYFFCFSSALNHDRDFKRVLEEFRQFDKVCPKLWAQVKKIHIDEFAINCNHSSKGVAKPKEFELHKDICLLINAILAAKCKNLTNNDLPLDSLLLSSNVTNSCPIKLYLTEDVSHPTFKNLTHFLAIPQICTQICYDLDHFENQCSALLRVHNLLSIPNTLPPVQLPGNTHQPLKNQTNSSLSPPPLANTHQQVAVPQLPSLVNPSPANETETIQEDITSNPPQVDPNPSYQYTKKGPFHPDPYQTQQTDYHQLSKELTKEEDPDMGKVDPLSNDKFLPGEGVESNNQVETRPDKEGGGTSKEGDWIEGSQNEREAANPIYSGGYFQAEESHFFFYFLMFSSVIVLGYFAFHNKNKILAYALEGRSERRSRRRPNPAKYRRLETNLEEAMGSSVCQQSAASTVVY